MKNMKNLKLLSIFIIISGIIISCSSPKEKSLKNIKTLEENLFADNIENFDMKKAEELLNAYTDFAKSFPDDENSDEYLFKAADISMNIGQYKKSIELLDKLITNYPDFEKIPECMHLRGFIYEDKLDNLGKAETSYRELIEKYPEHILAENAKACIENLGIPAEELIRRWEAKNDSTLTDTLAKK